MKNEVAESSVDSHPAAYLLPFYLKLYDDVMPDLRKKLEIFASAAVEKLNSEGISVKLEKTCRVRKEFKAAVKRIEKTGASAIITLHLAYSPSLESAGPIAASKLPVIILNTTPDFEFNCRTDAERLLENHGIHGVQDFCNLLIRKKKKFIIESGHITHSTVIQRTASAVKAAAAARRFRRARVGIIGKPFKGMGDFAVPFRRLKKQFGIKVINLHPRQIRRFLPDRDSQEVQQEINTDKSCFETNMLESSVHLESVRTGLALRKVISHHGLSSFSINFQYITAKTGIPVMPFLEINKAMARGTGYAGEGDVLTAAFTGAIFTQHPDASFAEMFCPDWKSGTVFLSHMGEINCNSSEKKPVLFSKEWPFTSAGKPAVAAACFKPGTAVFVCIAPILQNRYRLIICPVTMLAEEDDSSFKKNVRGWMKPALALEQFLTQYSILGGIHHGVVIYSAVKDELSRFGEIMNFEVKVLDGEGKCGL